MGTHHSKEKQYGKPYPRIEVIEFELKLTTLDSYISFQIEQIKKLDLPYLETKLANKMTATERNAQVECEFANSILHEYHHIQILQAASLACVKLIKNFETVEMITISFNKVPTELVLALETILFLVDLEKRHVLGQYARGLRELFRTAFGSQILEELEKFNRLAVKEDLNAFRNSKYPSDQVNNFLATFAKEKGIMLVNDKTAGGYLDKGLNTKTYDPSTHQGYLQKQHPSPLLKEDVGHNKIKYESPGLHYQPPEAYAKQTHTTQPTNILYQQQPHQHGYDPSKKPQYQSPTYPTYQAKYEGYAHHYQQPQLHKQDQPLTPTKKIPEEKQIPTAYKKDDKFPQTTAKKHADPLFDIPMTTSTLMTSPFTKVNNIPEPQGLNIITEEKHQENFGAAPKKKVNPIQALAHNIAKIQLTNPKQIQSSEEDSKKGFFVSFFDNINKITELEDEEKNDQTVNILGLNVHERNQPGFTQLFNQLSDDVNMPMLASVAMRPSLKYFYDPNVINFLDRKRDELRKTGKKFIDNEFPLDASSLGYSANFMQGTKLSWARLDASYKPKVTLFDRIKPDVLKQGALGDCYLLCGIAALAEIPEFLKRLIYPKEICKEGIYAVTLCDSGAWRTVIVDDFVPCYKDTAQPAFSRHIDEDNGIWIPLMEKAYAKLFQSYQAIVSGNPTYALNSLTGAPTEFLDLQDEKFLENPNKDKVVWEYLQKMQNSGYLSVASSTDDQVAKSHLPLTKKGIVEDHAYTILGIQAIRTDSGGQEKLIKLRNPWGKMEWNGDWSDDSPLWTTYTKAQVLGGVVSKNDGIFYMNVRDFIKCYADISTCKFHPRYHYSFLKIEGKYQREPRNISIIKFAIRKKMKVYVSIFQKERRHFRHQSKTYDFSFLRANIVKINPSNTSDLEISEYVCGDFQAKHSLTLNSIIEPGHYLLVVETFWNQDFCNDLVVGGYAEEEVHFEDYSVHKYKHNRIIAQMVMKFVKSCIEKKDLASIRETEYTGAAGVKRYNSFRVDGFWFCYFENQSKSSWIEETLKVNVDPIEAAEVVYPPNHSGNLSFENRLGPGQETLILLKINSGESLNISFQTSFKVKTK